MPPRNRERALTRIAFTCDEDTLAMLDDLAGDLQKQAIEAGILPHGQDHGRSRAIRKCIQYMHAHRKEL